jgi:DNA-binding response OmpR family regulator
MSDDPAISFAHRLMILDDNPKDILLAEATARAEGFKHIEAFNSATPAVERIELGLHGDRPLPEVMILDLDLGSDSGYDVLRLWYRKLASAGVRVIVWSQLEERNREICDLFHVDAYVCKWDGQDALREALIRLRPTSPSV